MTSRKAITALFAFLFFAVAVWADSEVRIVRLSLVDGPVQLDRGTGDGFERAIMNMPITNGMQIWTQDDSRAEIEFEEGNTVRITPGTRLEFSRLILRTDGTRTTLLTISSGRAYVNYNRKSGEDFRIMVGSRELALDHSVHFRIDVENDRAEIAVFGGEVFAGPLKVKKNNTGLIYFSDGSTELAKGIAPALEDSWDDNRADYHDTYAKSGYNGSRYYGRSDLNYYGGWLNTSYGSCWRPYGYDASWDPYSSGAWVYYPGYGYSFVSLYPWGWQPYRSGAWNYAGGSGWCWTPNRRYYGLGWAPVYHGPYGYRPAQPPTTITQTPTRPWHPGRGKDLVPVGNVDTTGNWRATDTISPGRGGRGHRGEPAPVVGGGVRPSGGAAAVSTTTGTSAETPGTIHRGDRTAGPTSGERNPRKIDSMREESSRPDSENRGVPRPDRQVQREQRQVQHEQHRPVEHAPRPQMQQRSVERAPAPSAPAPRMSAPAPAPAPPARSESRGPSRPSPKD